MARGRGGSSVEHRWGERLNLHIPVRLLIAGTERARGYLNNISISGAFVSTARPAPTGARIDLEILLDDGSIGAPHRVAAHVARVSRDGIGLEWCDLAPAVARVLLGNAAQSTARLSLSPCAASHGEHLGQRLAQSTARLVSAA